MEITMNTAAETVSSTEAFPVIERVVAEETASLFREDSLPYDPTAASLSKHAAEALCFETKARAPYAWGAEAEAIVRGVLLNDSFCTDFAVGRENILKVAAKISKRISSELYAVAA